MVDVARIVEEYDFDTIQQFVAGANKESTICHRFPQTFSTGHGRYVMTLVDEIIMRNKLISIK